MMTFWEVIRQDLSKEMTLKLRLNDKEKPGHRRQKRRKQASALALWQIRGYLMFEE